MRLLCQNIIQIHHIASFSQKLSMIHMPPNPMASAGCDTTLFLCKKLTFEIKIYTQTRVSCSISLKTSRGNMYAPYTPSN